MAPSLFSRCYLLGSRRPFDPKEQDRERSRNSTPLSFTLSWFKRFRTICSAPLVYRLGICAYRCLLIYVWYKYVWIASRLGLFGQKSKKLSRFEVSPLPPRFENKQIGIFGLFTENIRLNTAILVIQIDYWHSNSYSPVLKAGAQMEGGYHY